MQLSGFEFNVGQEPAVIAVELGLTVQEIVYGETPPVGYARKTALKGTETTVVLGNSVAATLRDVGAGDDNALPFA